MALTSSTPSAQRVVGNHEHKENATFRGQRLAAVPGDVLTMRNLVVLDMSKNQLTRFPGALVAADMPRLEVLLLQENVLYVLEDILALSTSPRLRELNLLQNPLRLVENRVYLLEALLSATTCDEKLLRMVQKDEALKTHSTPVETSQAMLQTASSARKMHHRSDRRRHQPQNATMQYMSRLPRRSGFPMLQKLNTDWITDADIHAVEQERGRPIEYFERRAAKNNRGDLLHRTTTVDRRFDGSRMTAKELLRRQTRSVAIPEVAVIERFQIDVESSAVVDLNDEELVNNKNATDSEDNAATGMTSEEATAARSRDEEEHLEVIHRLFQKSTTTNQKLRRISSTTLLASSSKRVQDEADAHSPTAEKTLPDEHVDPWNHPIQTFDDLSSVDRQYIRHRSRQSVESNLQRDDQFFDSTIFLDCIAQTERSRRLVVQAVDTICPPSASFKNLALYRSFTDSAPTLPPASTAAQQLRETMASKFNVGIDRHEFDKIERFRDKARASGFDERDVQAALSEYFENEHRLQQQRTRQLLSTTCEEPPRYSKAQVESLESAACAMDESLSRTKLRNAVDLANVLLNKKQEKHMIQMLIDADAKVIEEERAALDQALHRHHLELIASNQFFSQSQHETDREWMRRAARTHATKQA
ncbi:hypothetical protein Poli38472_003548 [Pythium oligandrum]|uniref:Uncharacterized protein n=1 Tax=Pythium oligandrum TaxID=41045 RepID=A0A8K1C7E3_PYTOL|nr:hypothetical protein Poli38472_003548 [Pythium oligandrum]|eukprot:TMW57623.1 hypothetical protein Poli38472_003548 [Pythium oligandrum]